MSKHNIAEVYSEGCGGAGNASHAIPSMNCPNKNGTAVNKDIVEIKYWTTKHTMYLHKVFFLNNLFTVHCCSFSCLLLSLAAAAATTTKIPECTSDDHRICHSLLIYLDNNCYPHSIFRSFSERGKYQWRNFSYIT